MIGLLACLITPSLAPSARTVTGSIPQAESRDASARNPRLLATVNIHLTESDPGVIVREIARQARLPFVAESYRGLPPVTLNFDGQASKALDSLCGQSDLDWRLLSSGALVVRRRFNALTTFPIITEKEALQTATEIATILSGIPQPRNIGASEHLVDFLSTLDRPQLENLRAGQTISASKLNPRQYQALEMVVLDEKLYFPRAAWTELASKRLRHLDKLIFRPQKWAWERENGAKGFYEKPYVIGTFLPIEGPYMLISLGEIVPEEDRKSALKNVKQSAGAHQHAPTDALLKDIVAQLTRSLGSDLSVRPYLDQVRIGTSLDGLSLPDCLAAIKEVVGGEWIDESGGLVLSHPKVSPEKDLGPGLVMIRKLLSGQLMRYVEMDSDLHPVPLVPDSISDPAYLERRKTERARQRIGNWSKTMGQRYAAFVKPRVSTNSPFSVVDAPSEIREAIVNETFARALNSIGFLELLRSGAPQYLRDPSLLTFTLRGDLAFFSAPEKLPSGEVRQVGFTVNAVAARKKLGL